MCVQNFYGYVQLMQMTDQSLYDSGVQEIFRNLIEKSVSKYIEKQSEKINKLDVENKKVDARCNELMNIVQKQENRIVEMEQYSRRDTYS